MSDTAYPGWQDILDHKEPFNAISFLIRQMMAGYSHVALVLVTNVTASDTDGAPPTVDVQPMVAMVDQTGTAQDHGTIYKIPVFRPQAGNSAFICDPRKDDIGFVVCADRDISSAFANQAAGEPRVLPAFRLGRCALCGRRRDGRPDDVGRGQRRHRGHDPGGLGQHPDDQRRHGEHRGLERVRERDRESDGFPHRDG